MKQRLEATFRNQKMLDENLLSGTNSQFQEETKIVSIFFI
jgi:hypothetical protein